MPPVLYWGKYTINIGKKQGNIGLYVNFKWIKTYVVDGKKETEYNHYVKLLI